MYRTNHYISESNPLFSEDTLDTSHLQLHGTLQRAPQFQHHVLVLIQLVSNHRYWFALKLNYINHFVYQHNSIERHQ
jgi:hypothetical protein